MRRGYFLVCCCVILYSPVVGFERNLHSRGSFVYIHPCRIFVPSGESTVASFLLNTTVQFASHMGPTPMSILVKYGMMYPVVGKSAANCGIGGVDFAADVATCPLAVPTLIVAALVSSGPCGAFGAM